MSISEDRGDPERSIWESVSALEKKAFTRTEIVDALRNVLDDLTDERD